MIRILTAAAVAALLAGPAMAQNAPGSDSRSPSQLEQQQRSLDQGSGSTFGMPGNIPTDCAPNDPRPECQTAQIPEIPSPQSPGSEPPDRSVVPSSPYSDSPSGGSSGGSGSSR